MRRTLCFSLLVLLLSSSGTLFAQARITSRPRAHPRVIVVHRYHFHSACFLPTYYPTQFLYAAVPFSPSYYPVLNNFTPAPEYVFVGSNSPARLQLVFKDGTSYFVSDWWRADDQLHFVTMEEGGTKSVPHNVPFDNLDLERTKAAATTQGFKFLIRDQPIEQWLDHHGHEKQLGTRPAGKHP